ncbi:sugar phosphate isomerase/epimerase family protein [Neotabrizicola shimadae]|uniref:Sugar phosphate isomerase/epimerase n=1 Tax=Neotabrizicola shimadae TaxID=2807096 RepID=A0A8G0ZX35_9RHOB|nr:TIM barrel protein [Neotabrizicola shimadae]QYZ70290.1 sugar phosphate isomerase/epimerase [Neotabrizicola shimadae]
MSDAPPGFAEPGADWRAFVASLSDRDARRLGHRAVAPPLYAHAYAFHLNFRFGAMAPPDLLTFAAIHGLSGVKIHVQDGEARSLLHAPDADRRAFGAMAARLGLTLHIETSSTLAPDLAEAAAIAHATGATSLRFYPRHAGPLSEVLARTVADLAILDRLDPQARLSFTLEQHEDLTSAELLAILDRVGHPRLSLLFDFGNMINAGETPLAALSAQAPRIAEVHVKDARALPDRGGWAHLACATGTGHLPMHTMLARLLLLGQDRPQVTAFGLEEEEGYLAPAFRFPGEGPDPVIPPRPPSETDPGPGDLAERLARERDLAIAQVCKVRAMLADLAAAARR